MKNNAGRWFRIGITGIVLAVLIIWYSVGENRSGESVKLGQPVLETQEKTPAPGPSEPGFDGNLSRDTDGTEDAGGAANADRTERADGPEDTGTAEDKDKTESAGRIFIHVCGEVVSPGVYELSEGSRLYEAVEAAGGLTDEADGDFLNMAQALSDGMQLRIPDRREAEELRRAGYDPAGSMTADGGAQAGGLIQGGAQAGGLIQGGGAQAGGVTQGDGRTQDGRINLNTATKEQLMTLSGIGEARAEAILAYRRESGGFKTIEDIMKVSGIKEAAFQKIKEDITV